MKKTALAALLFFALAAHPSIANVAEFEWLGRVSALGGAESETWKRKDNEGGSAHGLVMGDGLFVIPIFPMLGFQITGNYQASFDATSRWSIGGGPVFGWPGGKAGVFVNHQYRNWGRSHESDLGTQHWWFLWIQPALSLYDLIPGSNIDIWYSHPIGSAYDTCQKGCDYWKRKFFPYSQLKAAVNWFPPIALFGKDNIELTVGVQVNGFSGPDKGHAGSGVGPTAGMAMMPFQNFEVQLFRVAIDNHNRYRVTSGLHYYFTPGNPSLLQMRRRYLEPTQFMGPVTTFERNI